MKLFKIFSALLLLVLILVFLLKNTEEVAIDLIFIQYEQVNIAFVMIGALAIGILIGYGVAVTSIISSKSESRSLMVLAAIIPVQVDMQTTVSSWNHNIA